MPRVDKSAPVQLNVDTVVAAARRLAAGADAKKPLLVGADGNMQVCEPKRALPDGWTKFKAALINVPLIGRLPTIREASQLIRAARFHDSFHAELAGKFGNDIAVAVMSRDNKPPKATLSSRKVINVVDRARERAKAAGRENDAAILGDESPNDVARFARLIGVATHPEYFRKSLDATACEGLHADAETALQRMLPQSGGELPESVDAVLLGYERRLRGASAADQPGIATECLLAVENLVTILSVHASSLGDSSVTAAPRPPCIEDVRVVRLLCANAAGPDVEHYSPETATQAWKDLSQVQAGLRAELPSISEDVLADVMREVTAGQTDTTPQHLHEAARKELFIREMKRQFNPADPESTLWNAVIEATEGHPVDCSATALFTSISKEMLLDLDFRWQTLPGHFACANHLPTIIAKTRAQLIENVRSAATNHIKALDFIAHSDALTPSQKDELRSYAAGDSVTGRAPQRLSPVQVEQLIGIANTIALRLPQVKQADAMGEPAVLFDSMAEISGNFQHGMGEILKHAESMWISRSFDGTDTEQRMFDLCVRLAMARLADFPSTLVVQTVPLPPPAERERFYDSTVRQFLNACNASPVMNISKYAMFFGDIARVTREPIPDDARRPPPLSLTRPELLVRTLAHPDGNADAGGALDERGVLIGTPNGALVARNFNHTNVFDARRHQFQPSPPDATPESMDGMFSRIVDRAHIFINGRRLIGDVDNWKATVIKVYSTAFKNEPGEIGAIDEVGEPGATIAACMSSRALPNFVADVNAAAFQPPVMMANLRGAHEIWRNADGSWYLRSTHVSSPMGQDGKTIHTDGVVLYTLTHRIEPATGDAAPRVTLHDSNVVFAF